MTAAARCEDGQGKLLRIERDRDHGRDTGGRVLEKWIWRPKGQPSKTFLVTGRDQAVIEREREKQRRADAVTPVDAGTAKVSDMIASYLAHKRSNVAKCGNRTARGYESEITTKIRPFFQHTLNDPLLSQVTPQHVDWFKDRYLRDLSARTQQKVLRQVHEMFELARKRGLCIRSPVVSALHIPVVAKQGTVVGQQVGDQRTGRVVPAETLAKIVAKVRELRPRDPTAPVVVQLAAACGWRREEIIHLKLTDVELDGKVIWVRPFDPCGCKECVRDRHGKWYPKRAASIRPTLVPPELMPMFTAYLAERKVQHATSTWLFPCEASGRDKNRWQAGAQRGIDWAGDDFMDAADAVRVGHGFIFKDLRSTCNTSLLKRSYHSKAVDIVIGHALPRLDQTYTDLTADLPRLYELVFG
jgi:integrase